MIGITMNEMVMTVGCGFAVLLFAAYLLGHAARGVWWWIDRDESSIRHIIDILIPTYVLCSDRDYVIGKGSMGGLSTYYDIESAKLFFSEKSAEKFKQLALDPSRIEVTQCNTAILKLIGGILVASALTGLALLTVNFPSIMMFTLSGLGAVFGSRYLRDLQKAAIKIKNALKTHINDTKAHTTDSAMPDLDIKIGMEK